MWAALAVVLIGALAYVSIILSIDSYGVAFVTEAVSNTIGGALDIATAPVMHLVQAPFTPGPGVTLATSTEANFAGYAPRPLTAYNTPHLLPNGSVGVDASPLLTWTPTGPTPANTLAGWILVDHAGNMVSNGAIQPNVLMDSTSSVYSMVWGFALTGGQYQSTVLP